MKLPIYMESHKRCSKPPNRYLNNAIQDWYEHQFNEVQSASCWGFFHNMDEGFPATKRLTELQVVEPRNNVDFSKSEYWVGDSWSEKMQKQRNQCSPWNIMKHIYIYIVLNGVYIIYHIYHTIYIIMKHHETHHPWASQYFPVLRHFSPRHWEIPLNDRSRRRVSGGTVVPGADNPSATTQSRANPQG